MNSTGPATSQILERIHLVRAKGKTQGVVALFSLERYTGPSSILVDDSEIPVRFCESQLEIRELLAEHDNDHGLMVIISRLTESELGQDVLARLISCRVYRTDSWSSVMARFNAHQIDPRIASDAWIADLLLDAPGNGFPNVTNGYLDAGTVWRTLLSRFLGLVEDRPDAETLLTWAWNGGVSKFISAPAKLREGFQSWVANNCGEACSGIVASLEVGDHIDPIAIGVVLEVLSSDEPQLQVDLRVAAARLERMHGNRPLAKLSARQWAEAAKKILSDSGSERIKEISQCATRADEILNEVGAARFAYLSSISPVGFAQRQDRFAVALDATLKGDSIAVAESAAAALQDHREARKVVDVANRVAMATRLARWLRRQLVVASGFSDAVFSYAADGAWVDRARTLLRGGESSEHLSRSYESLLERVRAARESQNEQFGRLLVEWNHAPQRSTKVVPIERITGDIVAPLAEHAPVLLLVLDGLSLGVFYELLESWSKRSWTILIPASLKKTSLALQPAIAALPTITEISRISLLAGERTRGGSLEEKQRFASNHDLLAVSSAKRPPKLFHKGELTISGGTELAEEVRKAIETSEQRIVGVVINAVDDALSGPEQVRPIWSMEYLSQHVGALLDAARKSERLMVVASDHGHVIDADTELHAGGEGQRWRYDNTPPQTGELLLDGGRVDKSIGGKIVAPWSERIRYCPRKNGYHGGISPQEVIVPVCTLTTANVSIDGWTEATLTAPDWWERGVEAVGQQKLPFVAAAAEAPKIEIEWVENLGKSQVWKSQKTAAGRIVPSDREVREILGALASRGGKLALNALAQRVGVHPSSARTRIAAVRRLLNVDGYAVLKHDYESEMVELDIELLRKQFQV